MSFVERRTGLERRVSESDRRRSPRFRFRHKAVLEIDGAQHEAECVDFSVGGCRLIAPVCPPVDASTTVRLDRARHGVWWQGRVSWTTRSSSPDTWLVGMAWSRLYGAEAPLLEVFLRPFLGSRTAATAAAQAAVDDAGRFVHARDLVRLGVTHRRRRRHRLASMAALTLGCALGVSLAAGDVLREADERALDLMQRVLPRRALHPKIAVVEVDDATLATFGWPLPRKVFAATIAALAETDPASVLLDVLFVDPRDSDGEALLAEALRAAPCSVLPSAFRGEHANTPVDGAWGRVRAFQEPLDVLAAAAVGLAHVHARPGADGVFRRVPPTLTTDDGTIVPLIGLRAYSCWARSEIRASADAQSVEIADPTGKTVLVPASDGGALLRYPEPVSAWETMNLVEVLKAYARGRDGDAKAAFKRRFANKFVLVGQSARSFGDWGPTPREPHAPLMAVHAVFLDNLLRGRFLTWAPPSARIVAVLVVLALALLMSWRVRGWLGQVATLGMVPAVIVGSYVALRFADVWLSPLASALAASTLVGGRALASAVSGERDNRQLRRAFEAFVSPEVLSVVMANPSELDMGGHRRRISILFSDIEGYTSLSNTLSVGEVLALLREYLDVMARVILSHRGTIDKIMGDGIMCFFGDPLPCTDHAASAAQVGLDMQAAMLRLQHKWKARGLPPLEIRVGIATGEAFVGNVGSTGHVEYTAIGPAVNLAARLESQAPRGGILICKDTAAEIGDAYLTEPHHPLKLKGFDEPYVPLTLRGRRA